MSLFCKQLCCIGLDCQRGQKNTSSRASAAAGASWVGYLLPSHEGRDGWPDAVVSHPFIYLLCPKPHPITPYFIRINNFIY